MNSTDSDNKNNKNNKKKELDKRRIVLISIAFLTVIVFIIIGSSRIDSQKAYQDSSKKVEGAATSSTNAVEGIRNAVEDKIQNIQNEASNIDVAEVASSSPQVQKIINDIKSIENYPSDQAKGLCEKVCSGL